MITRRSSNSRSASLRHGFTLLEMVISMLLVSVMLAAALNTVGAAKQGQRKINGRLSGHQLAQGLMAEILQRDYADSAQIDMLKSEILIDAKKVNLTLGPETGEDTGDRSRFDDIDDYDGWSASPPQEKDGTEMSHLTRWRREVVVQYVMDGEPNLAKTQDEGAKLITVTVTHDDVPVAELVALRTIGPPPQEGCCLSGNTCVDLLVDVCTALGGESQGADTDCATTVCSCLVAHWEFEDGNGTWAADSAGDHKAKFTSHGWTTGKINGGLLLSGDGVGVVAYDPELFASGQFTVMGWFNSLDDGGYHMIFSNGTTGNNQNPWFGTLDTELSFGFYDGDWRELSTAGLGWQMNVWYHAAATFDSTTDKVRLYLNGVEVATGTIPYELIDPGEDLWIGNSQFSNEGEGWQGILDDLRIYNCVLEADEILAIATGSDDVCGDAQCGLAEDPCTCPADCGVPTAFEQAGVDCDDGMDNDCDGDTDCDDLNCSADPACSGPVCGAKNDPCGLDSECCSGKCNTKKGKCK